MARTACVAEGKTLRVKMTLPGTPEDALSNSVNAYAITLGTAVAADINNLALSGTPTVSGNEIYVDIVCPAIVGGSSDKTFSIVMSAFSGTISETWNVTIKNRYISSQSRAFATSATSVDEGNSVTVTATFSNVNGGDTVAYTVSGVTTADIGGESLTGNLTFVEGCSATIIASKTFNITADASTEGTETMVVTLATGESVSITVNDTSPTPAPAYNMTVSPTSATEGTSFTYTWTATNTTVADGTVLSVTMSGSAVTSGRYSDSTTFNTTVNSNQAQFTQNTNDLAGFQGTETLTATVTTSPYGASATASVTDDEVATFNNLVTVPLSWLPAYDTNDNQLTSLTPYRYITVPAGTTNVPTAVTVTKGSTSTIAINSTTGIDVTANQGGYKAQLITTFNGVGTSGPVTGTVVDAVGYAITT